MTDEEIIKAKEICLSPGIPCDDCPLVEQPDCDEITRQYFYKRFKELKAENAALRERLDKSVELPKPFIEQDRDGYYRVYSSRISIIRYAKQHGVYDTPEAAEARLKELQGGEE